MATKISQEFAGLKSKRLGLIIGPCATITSGFISETNAALAKKFGVEENASHLVTSQTAQQFADSPLDVREYIRSRFNDSVRAANLESYATVHWRAIFSVTPDTHLETLLRAEADKKIHRPQITVLSPPNYHLPPRTTPVIKLLGSILHEEFVYTQSSYLKFRAKWRKYIKLFSDAIQDGGVLCVGMEQHPYILQDLIAELSNTPEGLPRKLYFSQTDPLCNNKVIQGLVEDHIFTDTSTVRVDRFLNASRNYLASNDQLSLFEEKSNQPYKDFAKYRDFAITLNVCQKSKSSSKESNRLKNILFSPNSLQWDPFVHDLDFRRSIENQVFSTIYDEIKTMTKRSARSHTFVLKGNVACGKTTLLKRLAYDLSKKGELVFWLHASTAYYQTTTLTNLFKTAKKSRVCKRQVAIVFVDDPPSFGSLTTKDIEECAQRVGLDIFLIIGIRSNDLNINNPEIHIGSQPPTVVFTLADDLDGAEFSQLPQYIVDLGLAKTAIEVKNRLLASDTRTTHDTLCALYMLLPQTRSFIKNAIRQEYLRLGNGQRLAKAIYEALVEEDDLLRKIYGMVAVSDLYRTPLPLEILVSALGISYQEYGDLAKEDGPLWGLIYCDEDGDEGTLTHRTRNGVITQTIVETINGGSLGRGGELQILSTLIGACNSSQAVYIEYCQGILVNNPILESRLSFQEGIQLFDTALSSLPVKLRAMMHHKANWLRKRGKKPIEAHDLLMETLKVPNSSHSPKVEPDEFIYTSAAAAMLDAIEKEEIPIEEGKDLALSHLERVRASVFFEAKAVHVQAGLVLRLARQYDKTNDILKLLNKALSDIDRVMIELKSFLSAGSRERTELRTLSEMKDRILDHYSNQDKIQEEAERQWNLYQSQEGYALAARALFREAELVGKGNKYLAAFNYCQHVIKKVRSEGFEPAETVLEALLHIYYRWRVQRTIFTPLQNADDIDWKLIAECSSKVASSQNASDIFPRYLLAISLAHLNKWQDADSIFSDIRATNIKRKVLFSSRDLLLHSKGGRRTVQGTVKKGANAETFLYCEELQRDFNTARECAWPSAGGVAHATIHFSFAGPRAYLASL